MVEASSSSENGKAAGTRRIRRIATGILLGLTAVFLGSFAIPDPPFIVLLIRAMAEAGMVGGLADWFAVEALFRHPLRLPIPHTALLPKNQKRAATNIAKFIDEYFLVPDQLLDRVRQVNPVRKLAEWMSLRENADMVARELSQLLRIVVKAQLRHGINPQVSQGVRDMLLSAVGSGDLARNLSRILKDSARGKVLDEILVEVRNVIDQNRGKVTELVQENSRWWIASSIDKQVVRLLVDGILSILDDLADETSELRSEFNTSIGQFIDTFRDTGKIERYLDEGRTLYANSPEFEAAITSIIETLLSRIDRGLEEQPETASQILGSAAQEFAQSLLAQPELERQLTERFQTGLATILEETRPMIVRYATQVISDWDSDELVDRIEMEVGQDLQFIRINGAVLGAFVGGILFLFTQLIH